MEDAGPGPLIRPESLLRVRADLDRRQATQLDAIAVAAIVVDLLYRRLVASIERFGASDGIELLLPDAWGMIDWVHRLDGLVERCRGLSPRSQFVIDYRNASRLVENHRHSVQHLEGTLPALERSGRAPWGHMTWTVDRGTVREGHRQFEQRLAASSLIRAVDQEFRMGQVIRPRTRIDNVSLYSADGEAEIGLTGQHEALVRFVRALEAALAASGPPGDDGILRIRAG